jgi:hypothetical protein
MFKNCADETHNFTVPVVVVEFVVDDVFGEKKKKKKELF